MALKYWHALETNSDGHDIARDVFFRTDDTVITDDAVRTNFLNGVRFEADGGALIQAGSLQNLQPATVDDFDTWNAQRLVQ